MRTPNTLIEREAFEVLVPALDQLQNEVREGLHLELLLARGRLILTPHLAPLRSRSTPGLRGTL